MGKILHASGSGYFPECIAVGAGKFGGGVFSLDQFMKLYWRAKAFKFTMSGEIYVTWPFPYDEVDNIPALYPFEYNNIITLSKYNAASYYDDDDNLIMSPVVNEEEMVCGVFYEPNRTNSVLPGDSTTLELGGVLATSNDFNNPATLYNFNPNSGVRIDADDQVPDASLYLSLGPLGTNTLFPNTFPFVTGMINFGGVQIQSRMHVFFSLDYLSMDASQSSFTASFEVDEYFSFGGTINTSTGEPL